MRQRKNFASSLSSSGQALIETVLVIPLLIFLVLNAINFGYFFATALNLAAAPRTAGLYSIMGQSTPRSDALPPAGDDTNQSSVTYMTYQDMSGTFRNWSTAPIRVCSLSLGVNPSGEDTTAETVNCVSYNMAGPSFPTLESDPAAPVFKLNRIDIRYTFRPLIPGWIFSLALLPAPICTTGGGGVTCTFHRQATMRAMN